MEAAAEHCLRAYEKQVRIRVIGGRAWVGDRAHGIGDVGTDASDSAAVLSDRFRASWPSEGGHVVSIDTAMVLVSVRWQMLVSSTLMDRYPKQGCQSTNMKDLRGRYEGLSWAVRWPCW